MSDEVENGDVEVNYGYAKTDLNDAVYKLALGVGNIRSRLQAAYAQLSTLREQNKSLPEETQADLDWITKTIEEKGPIQILDDETAVKIAKRILAMLDHLRARY